MSSSSIYNHRSLQPAGAPPPGSSSHSSLNRLNDAFDAIKTEFELLSSDLGMLRAQRDEYEGKLSSQINELSIFRQQLYDLEAQHAKIRLQYEEEVNRLRADLLSLRQNQQGAAVPGPPSAPVPPLAGPGPSSAGSHLPPGAAPPFPDPYYRDRDLRERDRPTDQRDPKRLKTERMRGERPDLFSPSLSSGSMPKLPPVGSGPPPPAPPPSSSLPPNPSSYPPPTNSSFPHEHPPPNGSAPGGTLITTGAGGFPEDLDIHTLPPEFKREGSDWFAIFNPKVKRVLDVQLVHALMHESVVCCVRFSADGKYLATGCNRTAQIYDVKTGQKTCVLADEAASKAGDLYIRSVCFSPDGKFLATGAEDKQIRIWDIGKKRIRNIFDGHQQEIYSLDFSHDGRLIVSGSGDKTARIWDMLDGTSKVLTINDPDSLNNDAGVTSVAISPNGQLVAAGSLDTVVRIWDVASGQLIERLRGHRDSVYSVAFTPDGKGLISGSLDKTLKCWDVSSFLVPGALKARKEATAGQAQGSPGGSNSASATGRKDSLGPGDKPSQCTMNFTGHKDYVLSVAVSHDGRWVVSGSKDRGVQFWDSMTAAVQCMLQGHKNSVISIDLSPTGNVLATGSGDWQARIWSYSTV